MSVCLLRLRGAFNTGGTINFMVFCALCDIKTSTNMQVDTFIFLLFCCLFGVYVMRFIYTVIVKEIVFISNIT